ncbi:hypothetical protein FOXG_19201 [Fusarium oxysporum f. sp. lycopersici 4287]|uniref:Uncharacterized protein n=2 Tax=Fusarium oxysporum TaxID=5507 RepID=A0A0J9UY42_FUSO4|nr:hypothetical protein FOXG_19201 [Fusarium oxysporum f. sp. lycopersici 4287]EXK33396.1 hypothetical protein FOMG_12088 [Fusarium oxysporum f. sp. melonis 26406]KNB03818.1 hypothetical protein FOXG_19201 [Fusarium oxysporum f. sp. lycopersici 4287]
MKQGLSASPGGYGYNNAEKLLETTEKLLKTVKKFTNIKAFLMARLKRQS